MSDFEISIISAISRFYQTVTHSGCYFYFRHCIWRELCKIGMNQGVKAILILTQEVKKLNA
ncbi:hypothetical protein HZS_2379 [Henneguya salminicola]|nr:hypothetical protein HZS_2379 [Henneguya salminicola]